MCIRSAFWLMIGLSYAAPSFAEGVPWEFRSIRAKDDRPLERVRALLETRDGSVWFGTWGGGVYVFDGLNWRTIKVTEGLASNWVRSLAQGDDGSIWVGGRGLSRIRGQEVEAFQPQDLPELTGTSCRAFAVLENGDVWVSFDLGQIVSYRPSSGSWTRIAGPEVFGQAKINSIVQAGDGNIFCALDKDGIRRFDGESWKTEEPVRGVVDQILEDRHGVLWAVGEGRLWRREGLDWRLELTLPETIFGFDEAPDGSFYLATRLGVRARTDLSGDWALLDLGNELVQPRYHSVLFSRDGTKVWLGSDEGAIQGVRSPWTRFDRAHGGTRMQFKSFSVGRDQPPTVIDTHGRLAIFDGVNWNVRNGPADKNRRTVVDLISSSDGLYWLLSNSHCTRFSRVDEDSLESVQLDSIELPPEGRFEKLFAHGSGRPWILGEGGVRALSEGRWISPRPGSPQGSPALAAAQRGDDVFVCYPSSVERWSGNEVVDLATEFPVLRGREMKTVTCLSDGKVWIGTYSDGVFVIDGSDIRQMTSSDGMTNNTVNIISEGPDGSVWVAYYWSGVGRFHEDGWVNHGYAQGLPNDHLVRLIPRSEDEVWAATQNNGVLRYVRDRDPPETVLRSAPTEVSSHGVAGFSWSGLDPWSRTARERLRYSWRAKPVDGTANWSAPRSARSIVTEPLSSGEYDFQVRAVDLDGNVDPTPAKVRVRVAYPFWKRAAFVLPIGILSLASFVAAFLFYRSHVTLRASQAALARKTQDLQAKILEREKTEAARQALEEQLGRARKLQAVGTLAAGVAHDINNSLAAILGYVELVEALPKDDPSSIGAFDGVRRTVRQATGVTRSLLTFSRRGRSDKRTVNLSKVVAEAEATFRPLLPSAVEARVQVADEELWCCIDPVQMQQIVINLVVNARDAMPAGGLVILSTQKLRIGDDHFAGLSVEDNGLGMSEETKGQIFEPFYTTKTREKGTGLGMAIVHGLVADHGGLIDVESRLGQGTEFTLRFPLVAPPSSEGASTEAIISAESYESRSTPTLLLVEDHPALLDLMSSALESAGYEVLNAEDGSSALKLFKENSERIDLVVLDVDLPGMNGLDCLAQFRDMRGGLPAVVISGLPEVQGRDVPPGSIFLAKPFPVRELLRCLEAALASCRSDA